MTTRNAHVAQSSANIETEAWRHLDPVSAVIKARQVRNQVIARFLRAAAKSAVAAIAGWFRGRAVYQELNELPDHLLDDIGVRRDQLSAIAHGGFRRPATDLEVAVGRRSLSFFEHKPAAVDTAPQNDAPGDHKPLAA